jgi:hypothetical protein
MKLTARAVMIATFALLASPAAGQQQPQQPDETASEIVVTGARVREEQVREFVSILTPPRGSTIPRFIDQVCPVTVGVAPAQKEAVNARLRHVAAAIGLRVAGRNCLPNAFVIVVGDKRAFIELLARERRHSFGSMSGAEIGRLARSPGPAAAWQLSGPVDADGVPLPSAGEVYVNRTTLPSSRLRSASPQAFDASALVVESAALVGLTTTQVADYAAMRLFAKLDPARLPAASPPTILTALEAPMGSAVPITLTDWDVGLLRGLYASSTDLDANGQQSQIVRRVTRHLDRPDR